MKRVTYISNFSKPLSSGEVEHIGEISSRNNAKHELTGILFCFNNIFYQIIEGDDEKLDKVFQIIKKDERHKNLFTLDIEYDIKERAYAEWSMKTVIMDASIDPFIQPVRSMLDALTSNHRILEKYAPEKVLACIQAGINPLDIQFAPVNKTILFSDMFASTIMAEVLPVEQFSRVLDTYYSIVLKSMHDHGGTIAKLTGDGLMAYFSVDATGDAVKASVQALDRLNTLRKSAAPGDASRFLFAGFGITTGNMLEGNIGSTEKKDYTFIGDTVNTAARLESVTREVGRFLVMDEETAMTATDNFDIKKIEDYGLKGKSKNIDLFTVNEPDLIHHFNPESFTAALRDI